MTTTKYGLKENTKLFQEQKNYNEHTCHWGKKTKIWTTLYSSGKNNSTNDDNMCVPLSNSTIKYACV